MLRTIRRTAMVALLAAGVATFLAAPAAPNHATDSEGVRLDAPGPGYTPDGFLSPDGGVTLATTQGERSGSHVIPP